MSTLGSESVFNISACRIKKDPTNSLFGWLAEIWIRIRFMWMGWRNPIFFTVNEEFQRLKKIGYWVDLASKTSSTQGGLRRCLFNQYLKKTDLWRGSQCLEELCHCSFVYNKSYCENQHHSVGEFECTGCGGSQEWQKPNGSTNLLKAREIFTIMENRAKQWSGWSSSCRPIAFTN